MSVLIDSKKKLTKKQIAELRAKAKANALPEDQREKIKQLLNDAVAKDEALATELNTDSSKA